MIGVWSRGLARALCLAAAPVFAGMALLTAGGPADMSCIHHGASLGGMAPMYLLMSLVHAAPWLRLLSGKPLG